MKVFLSARKIEVEIENQPSLGRGGEGAVYKIIYPKEYIQYCVKIYNPDKITPQKIQKIEYLLQNNPILDSKGHPSVIWVEDLVYTRKGSKKDIFSGILMPIAEGYSVEYLCAYKFPIQRILAHEANLYKKFERNHPDGIKTRLAVCYNIAVSVAQLHQKGLYVHADIKPENIIFNHKGKVSIIDFDNVQVTQNGKILFPALAQTPEYLPPIYQDSIQKNRVFISFVDIFSMTVIFYRILMGIHPFASTNFKAPYQEITDIPTAIKEGLFPFGQKQRYFNQISPPHQNFKKLPKHLQNLFLEVLEHQNTSIKAVDWMEAINPQKPKLHFPLLPLKKPLSHPNIEHFTSFTFEPNPILTLPTYLDNQYEKYHWIEEEQLKPSLLDLFFKSQKARACNEIIYLQNACKDLIASYKQLKKKHSDMLMHYAHQTKSIAQKAQQQYDTLIQQNKNLLSGFTAENYYETARDKAYKLLEQWLNEQTKQNPKIKALYQQYLLHAEKITHKQSLMYSHHITDIQQIAKQKKLSFEQAKKEYIQHLSQKYEQSILAIENEIQQMRKNINPKQWETHPWIQAELAKYTIQNSGLPTVIVKAFCNAGFFTAADVIDIDSSGQILNSQGHFVKIPQIGFTRANEVWTWKNDILKKLKKTAKNQNIDLTQLDTPEILSKKGEVQSLKSELDAIKVQINTIDLNTTYSIEQVTGQFWYQVCKESHSTLEQIIQPVIQEYEKFLQEYNLDALLAKLKQIIDSYHEEQLEIRLYYENTHQAYIKQKSEIETKLQENITRIKELWKYL
ncbi:MAG: protein kinase [Bacteroidia bacterium]|nr:protein kinase [Bacteroidia bacterium]MDW8347540.1 protein kinase [Bacteroidia bacterium]